MTHKWISSYIMLHRVMQLTALRLLWIVQCTFSSEPNKLIFVCDNEKVLIVP